MREKPLGRAGEGGPRVLIVDENTCPADDVAEASREAGARCVRMRGSGGLRLGFGGELAEVAVCAWLGGEERPWRAVDEVRASGFRGAVVTVLDRDRAEEATCARAHGVDDVMVRPVHVGDMRSMLSRWAHSGL
ncbi:MAG: hypothetical protein R3B57_06925 [Phycisphaerales bacterium]